MYVKPFLACLNESSGKAVALHMAMALFVCVGDAMFVLRFYGPVKPIGSCRARSVYLTTRLLGRLSPLSG